MVSLVSPDVYDCVCVCVCVILILSAEMYCVFYCVEKVGVRNVCLCVCEDVCVYECDPNCVSVHKLNLALSGVEWWWWWW